MVTLTSVDIPASHGFLEGLLRTPDEEGNLFSIAAVVCHPHPQYGGTMHNKVVATINRALNDYGIPSLRFNFRGVGRSTGSFDNGVGEQDDVKFALDWMSTHYPNKPLLVAGFSFGAWVGLRVGCTDPRVTHLIGVGVPVTLFAIHLADICNKPKCIIQGSDDEYGNAAEIRSWFNGLPEPRDLYIIDGASHFFPDQLDQINQSIGIWLSQ
jgi:alpha/beta superfamily hydrolase